MPNHTIDPFSLSTAHILNRSHLEYGKQETVTDLLRFDRCRRWLVMTTLRIMPRPFCLRDALLFLIGFAICCQLLAVAAGEPDSKWQAPASEKQRKNPIAANETSLTAGKAVYFRRCADCHGKTGNGDGPDAVDLGIHPAKFSDPSMRTESDGEFFWKITKGKKPMPSYEARLTPNDRWNVINYVRSLAK